MFKGSVKTNETSTQFSRFIFSHFALELIFLGNMFIKVKKDE